MWHDSHGSRVSRANWGVAAQRAKDKTSATNSVKRSITAPIVAADSRKVGNHLVQAPTSERSVATNNLNHEKVSPSFERAGRGRGLPNLHRMRWRISQFGIDGYGRLDRFYGRC